MKYDQLIKTCIEAIKDYNDKIEGPDSYIDIYIKSVRTIKFSENQT